MTVVAADLLADMRDLPISALGALLLVGLALWLTGWWFHRFWITAITSFAGGLIGLRLGPDLGVANPILSGVLLAVAAGCLALALVRLALFVIYGLICWSLMRSLAPPWSQPLVCMVAGGLFSVIFFRLCILMLTCAVGSILLAHAGLALADQMQVFPAVTLVKEQPLLVNIGLLVSTLLGVVIQHAMDKAHRRRLLKQAEIAEIKKKIEVEQHTRSRRGWFGLRKAG